MRLEKRKPSGREKDADAIRLLAKLREQLYTSNVSVIRQSAFHLSWLQEDGLEILKEALFGDTPRKTKGAAAYGMRKMRGRMRKAAEAALVQGLEHADPATARICRNALLVMHGAKGKPNARRRGKPRTGRFAIQSIPGKGRRRSHSQKGNRRDDSASRRR